MGTNKSNQASRAEQLIAGTKQHFANAASLAFAGSSFTPAQVEASLQTLVDLRGAVDTAKAATKTKVAAERAHTAATSAARTPPPPRPAGWGSPSPMGAAGRRQPPNGGDRAPPMTRLLPRSLGGSCGTASCPSLSEPS
jgi:hypothetical protein